MQGRAVRCSPQAVCGPRVATRSILPTLRADQIPVTRIFPTLALIALTFVVVAAVLGLTVDTSDLSNEAARDWKRLHLLAGILAAIAVMLVNGIVITYFIGTSRWCREVVEAYELEPELAMRSAALKRRAFPVTLAAMLVVVGMVALGGAADTAQTLPQPPMEWTWAEVHLLGTLLGTAFFLWVGYQQWTTISANQHVIGAILVRVREIRLAKGLDVDDDPQPGSRGPWLAWPGAQRTGEWRLRPLLAAKRSLNVGSNVQLD